jgi:hypothetical protein
VSGSCHADDVARQEAAAEAGPAGSRRRSRPPPGRCGGAGGRPWRVATTASWTRPGAGHAPPRPVPPADLTRASRRRPWAILPPQRGGTGPPAGTHP